MNEILRGKTGGNVPHKYVSDTGVLLVMTAGFLGEETREKNLLFSGQ